MRFEQLESDQASDAEPAAAWQLAPRSASPSGTAVANALVASSAPALPAQRRPDLPAAEPEAETPMATVDDLAAPVAPVADSQILAEPETAATAEPETVSEFEDPWPSPRRQIAIFTRILCALIIVILLGHRYIPDVMGFGSLLDTFLPWSFAPLLFAVPAALVSRSRWAVGVTALACLVWTADFGPALARSGGGTGPVDLRILSQNVSARNPDLTAVARMAVEQHADIVVLQGMESADVQAADKAAPPGYPYHLAMYEFSVWSRYKLPGGGQPIDLAPHDSPNTPAAADSGLFGGLLRFTVQLDANRTATVFAVHLPQPALSHQGFGTARGEALDTLVEAIKHEQRRNLIVVGDLDIAQTDRSMGKLLSSGTGLVSAQAKAGAGFGFTWPAGFPMVRLDDVLTRGVTPVRSIVLPAVGAKQAHRPIEADLRFG